MNAWRCWWRRTGVLGYLSLALCSLAVILFALYNPQSEAWVAHGTRSMGAGSVEVHSRGPVWPGELLTVRINTGHPVSGRIGVNKLVQHVTVRANTPTEIQLLLPPGEPELRLLLESEGERAEWYLGRLLFDGETR